MVDKKIGPKRVVLVGLLAVFLVLVITKSPAAKDLQPLTLRLQQINLKVPPITTPTAEAVLASINNYRQTNKLSVLKQNTDLDKAALARLTVIEASEDYSGKTTGVTLENAVKNNGYSYSLTGELDAINVIPGLDLVNHWGENADAVKLLREAGFKEMGVAIKNQGIGFDMVVVLAKPALFVVAKPRATWGGPELWAAVNKRRVEMGVNPLSQREELCTIASIRLNELLELGKLDNHAGFEPLLNRPDLAWIHQKYNIAEFLVYGYSTPAESVAAWENTLGHRELLAGGQYVWGCVYAQDTFGVAIAAY